MIFPFNLVCYEKYPASLTPPPGQTIIGLTHLAWCTFVGTARQSDAVATDGAHFPGTLAGRSPKTTVLSTHTPKTILSIESPGKRHNQVLIALAGCRCDILFAMMQ